MSDRAEPVGHGVRLEVRAIDATSPHFLLLECWALWDLDRHQYVRAPGSSGRIRRFYTRAAAEAHLRSSARGSTVG
ncbi:hypothetical protein ACFYUY_08240 [Kitasatospora sp. NPDC004745]|uniref:hypothetical protein n=1 Tax=Kitasatospora sp. NPDC004745 TaxID=3364019 RepID=UPI0036BF4C4E